MASLLSPEKYEFDCDPSGILISSNGVPLNNKPQRINYLKSKIEKITVSQGERYIKEGHFGKGSMEPKMLAAVKFVRSGGKTAIISSLDKALLALAGTAGTRVIT